ncbi:hypothetical protein [Mucilaginibacter antarcticus]|uniref:Uncharacterized protein n=1 Tax=Mucilaginibacter antarcticus TaxID=1855725 RepID=A0ABW5XTH6_9SPHI
MTFKELLAKYVSGNLSTLQLPLVAQTGLTEGLESESLIILAGLDNNENGFVVNQYFRRSIDELNIELPDKRTAALQYAFGIAKDIIERKREVIEAFPEMCYKAILSYHFEEETINYVYDSIFFERLYGLYHEYDDLLAVHVPGDAIYEKETNEIKNLMLTELIKWTEKIRR